MKKTITAVAILALVACGVLWQRSCRADAQLRQAKLEYAGYKAVAEADHEIQFGIITEKNKVIVSMTKTIGKLNDENAADDAEIALLKDELEAVVGQEPPTTPDIEALPIVVNLRGQVKLLKEIVAKDIDVIANREKVIDAWELKFNAQVDISEAWRKNYESEHILRVQAEGLFKVCERSQRLNKFWKTTTIVAGAIAIGAIITK